MTNNKKLIGVIGLLTIGLVTGCGPTGSLPATPTSTKTTATTAKTTVGTTTATSTNHTTAKAKTKTTPVSGSATSSSTSNVTGGQGKKPPQAPSVAPGKVPVTSTTKVTTTAILLSNVMSKTIAGPLAGVIFKAQLAPQVTAVDVVDSSHPGIQAVNVTPHVMTQGLFLLEAKNGDHVTLIPVIQGKKMMTSAFSLTIH